jgi:AraC-like DNA-binding protein
MIFKTYVLIFCLFPCLVSSQKQNLSNNFEKMSYEQLENIVLNDTVQKNKEKVAHYYYKKIKKNNNSQELVNAYYLLSEAYLLDFKKSLKYNDSIIAIAKDFDDKNIYLRALMNKGYLYSYLLEVEKSIDYFTKVYHESIKYNNFRYKILGLQRIAISKSEELLEPKEALVLFNKIDKELNDAINKNDSTVINIYLLNLFCIADAYKTIGDYDKTTYYNRLGYKECIKFKNNTRFYHFILNEGATLVQKKEYHTAIDSIQKALPNIYDEGNIMAGYYYLGKSYQGLKDKERALKFYKKVDSIDKLHHLVTPEFIRGYHFLINYYKEKKQPSEQLYYTNRFITIDSTFQINYKSVIKKIQKEYDIPLVLSQKEELIEDLKGESKLKYVVIFMLIILIIGLSVYLSQKNKKAIKRFNQIIQELEQANMETPKIEKVNKLVINDTRVQELDKKITQFEKDKAFLDKDLTINKLAEELGSNQKYLSEYINQYKNLTFNNYLNQLRITYIVQQLYDDKKLRKYSIESIADEAGFKKAETFANIFKAHTGVNPSYFIRELSKNITDNNSIT